MKKPRINWMLWTFTTVVVYFLGSCVYIIHRDCSADAKIQQAAGRKPTCEAWR